MYETANSYSSDKMNWLTSLLNLKSLDLFFYRCDGCLLKRITVNFMSVDQCRTVLVDKSCLWYWSLITLLYFEVIIQSTKTYFLIPLDLFL